MHEMKYLLVRVIIPDPLNPEIDHNIIKKFDWSEFYRDAKAIPVSIPEFQGKKVDI